MTTPLSVFLVEDHVVMRSAMVEFLTEAGGVAVKGEAATAEEALDRLDEIDADIIVIDLSLPGMNGIDLVRHVRARRSELTCVIYTGHGQKHYLARALAVGARGYLLKGDPEDLLEGLRRVQLGEFYVTVSLRGGAAEAG